MQEKLINRKRRLISNIIFRIVTLVSIMVMVIFCIYLRRYDGISKGLLIVTYIGLTILYLVLTLLVVPRKFKMSIKTVGATILVLLSFVFVFMIRSINKKIIKDNEENQIEEKIEEKEEKIEEIDNKEDSIE